MYSRWGHHPVKARYSQDSEERWQRAARGYVLEDGRVRLVGRQEEPFSNEHGRRVHLGL